MTTSPEPTTTAAVQQQELRNLAVRLIEGSGSDWHRLVYVVSSLGRYGEESLEAEDSDGGRRRLRVGLDVSKAARVLRATMASESGGTWFTATVTVEESLQYGANFDYDTEPSWETKPGVNEFLTEQERYPRSPVHQPGWFSDGLKAASSLS